MYQLPKSHDLGVNTCAACFEKQREIDRLREEVTRLKGAARAIVSVKRRHSRLRLPHLRRRFPSRRTPPLRNPRSAAGRKSVIWDMGGAPSRSSTRRTFLTRGYRMRARSVATS